MKELSVGFKKDNIIKAIARQFKRFTSKTLDFDISEYRELYIITTINLNPLHRLFIDPTILLTSELKN